ncbi:hypothetical protein MYX07_03795, partial [Patescibacteria group bacterium AH-259-L07]|nr:hypothetical protein [Patescibacteria group bacterium AH-259-L07]
MKILMQIRQDAYKIHGGDVIQLEKTKKYLKKTGIAVDTSTALDPNVRNYDLVHLFNLMSTDTYYQYRNAKKYQKLIVLSTIYWNRDEYLLNNPNRKMKLIQFIGGVKFAKFLLDNKRF